MPRGTEASARGPQPRIIACATRRGRGAWLSLMGLGCLLGQQGYSTPPAARSAQGSNPRGCAALRQLLIMQLRARAYADGHGPFIETDAAVLPGDAYYIQFGRAIVYHIPPPVFLRNFPT